ncbi:MAG: WYL domain-containing protein [Anaerobacillus sp.]
MMRLMKKSLLNKEAIEMIYLSKDSIISQRRVTLLDIKEDEVRGFCHLRRSVRTFKLERILSVYPLKESVKSISLNG